MAEIVSKSVPIQTVQTKDVHREITQIVIDPDDKIYWNVTNIVSGTTEVVQEEGYCVNASDLAYVNTTGDTFYNDIKNTLWTKTHEIDAVVDTWDTEVSGSIVTIDNQPVYGVGVVYKTKTL